MVLFDIETVPMDDEELSPLMRRLVKEDGRFNGVGGRCTNPDTIAAKLELDETQKKSIKVRSLTPDLGKIISIGVMVDVYQSYTDAQPTHGRPEVIVLQGMDEKKILSDFLALLRDYGAQLITFNGVNFDVPFFIKRCLYKQIPVNIELSTKRFTIKGHFDLLQYLSNYKTPTQGLKMSEYCSLFGIETSKDSFSGADVYPAYKAGEWDRLKKYSIDDCIATYELFMAVRPYCGYLFQYDDHKPANSFV